MSRLIRKCTQSIKTPELHFKRTNYFYPMVKNLMKDLDRQFIKIAKNTFNFTTN